AITCAGGRVRSVLVGSGDDLREVTGDYFVAALPVERMVEMLSEPLLKLDPSLVNLRELSEYVEWMNGIQYYLTEDVPIANGHAIFLDSPWALTSVSQAQFWHDVRLDDFGDGNVRGVLSVDISDWDVPGLNGKSAQNCSRAEIAAETWQQLKNSLNVDKEVLSDRQLHSWFLDPGIEDRDADADPMTPRLATNAEPLLVNYVDTWRLRPEAVTRIPNLFLASDYVRTFTDLATMEAANEAARRAVNGILRVARTQADDCALWQLHEPELFAPWRAQDRVRFREGLAWQDLAAQGVRQLTSQRAHDASEGETARIAAESRASSDAGLRRWRVLPGGFS
ncbi:MAG TPA: FAD-dependent oxidoreductase, partial [Polyangiales bacterium]|nr:FAD-dependent oxidoreductase [Polyangiales bacterium]